MKKGYFLALGLAFASVSFVSPATAQTKVAGTSAPQALPEPAAGKGQIVFWRPSSLVGAAMGCGVNIDKDRIGGLGNGRYFILPLDPGAYEFNAKSEAKDVLNIEVEDSETYYVKCTIRMGFMVGRPNLSPSSAEEFNNKRDKLKYVDSDDIGPQVAPDPGAVVVPEKSDATPVPDATPPSDPDEGTNSASDDSQAEPE